MMQRLYRQESPTLPERLVVATKPDILLQFAHLRLNRRTREVHRDARFTELTAKEFDLLDYLLAIPSK